MITQTLSNIYQSGTAADIDVVAYCTTLSTHQFYFSIGCITLLLLVTIYMTLSTIRGYVTKSCVGCKRLKKCEQEIQGMKIISKTYGRNLGTIHEILDKILGDLKK